jgi:hypothetical protein
MHKDIREKLKQANEHSQTHNSNAIPTVDYIQMHMNGNLLTTIETSYMQQYLCGTINVHI